MMHTIKVCENKEDFKRLLCSHAFIPDPVLDHSLHGSLQIPAIIIFALLVIFGIIILYAFILMKDNRTIRLEY